MSCRTDIAGKLEQAGFSDFTVDYQRGIAVVFFTPAPSGAACEKTGTGSKIKQKGDD